jgi:hypothetical protein
VTKKGIYKFFKYSVLGSVIVFFLFLSAFTVSDRQKGTLAQTPDPATVIDVVFVGENFTQDQLDDYHTSVNDFINALLTHQPFKSRAGQFAFHIIDNTTDLGCTDLFDCSPDYIDRAAQVIYESGYPVDTAALVINSTKTNGSATTYPIEMTVTGKTDPHVFVHEFGHSFGRLRDEYVTYPGDGQITNTTNFNCYRGIPPSSEWDDLVAIGDYWPGCTYQNWYRPAPLSIMYSSNFHYFNGPSQILLNQKITQLVGTIEDLEQPVVTITEPLNNQTVSGIINIKSLLSDNVGVTWGDMKLDGTLYKSIYVAPFDFVLDTTTLTAGTHTLMVRARDASQNMGSQTIAINVVPPTPTPTPTPIPVLISFSSASYSYRENAKNANMQVTLTTSSSAEVRINYQVTGGTASAGSDFSLANGELVFPSGTTSKNISVNLVNDKVKEPDETIFVSLTNPRNATLGLNPMATFTIQNDDR